MQKIECREKTLKQLLLNTKYTINYYQREYMWQRKQIAELIDDLTSEFLMSYKPDDSREAVKDYGSYFMGDIVLAGRENAIVDGQQRLTSLTLLLMYINNRLRKLGKSYSNIEGMIFSESYGKKSFNIDVADRTECMNAIFNDKPFDASNSGNSVKNLCGRYEDIVDLFPDEINDDILLHFCDWLKDNVLFSETTATAEQDAQKIFVAKNDRGISLTPSEMLKGYILSEIKDDEKRGELNELWKKTSEALTKNNPGGDDVFIRVWLRAQYARTIRDQKAGAVNEDFDIIGGAFHNWVRDEKLKLGLSTPDDYERFVRTFAEFAGIYLRIRNAEQVFADETCYIFYNAKVNFTLQAQLLLAPICSGDSKDTVTQKISLTARFIEIYIIARIMNGKSLGYSTIKNYVFDLTRTLRQLTVDNLKKELMSEYSKLGYAPDKLMYDFVLNQYRKKYIKHILARVTSFIEKQSGLTSNYCDYMDTATKNPFEIEHVIANHYDRFKSEYDNESEFQEWRNSIGALLLLRKKINASLSDSNYADKLVKYCSTEGNIYAASLGDSAYANNPGFIQFVQDNNLPFKPYKKFGQTEISERIKLLEKLFAMIWNSDMFKP